MQVEEVLASYEPLTPHFDLAAFCGAWQIVRTNLDLWKTRANPQISYTLLPDRPSPQMLDVVSFTDRGGRAGQITGIDQQDAAHPRLFRWRGDRWFSRWVTSRWCVVDHDPQCAEWAVTYFSATPFTKSGMDLLGRSHSLSAGTIDSILERLNRHPHLREHIAAFFAPHQRPFEPTA